MALTVKSNGSSAGNIISASWFNDFYNLFTGSMVDQVVRFTNSLSLQVPYTDPSSAPTLALNAGTNLGIGLYTYAYTYVNPEGGESKPSPTASVTTTSGNQQVALSGITTGSGATSKRNIYRSKVGGATLYLLTTLSNNTATTFTDTIADTALGTAQSPAFSSFGASIILKDVNGNQNATILQDPSNSGTLILEGDGKIAFFDGGLWGNPTAYFSGGTLTTVNDVIAQGSLRTNNIFQTFSNSGYIEFPAAGVFGFKKSDGVKVGEFRNNGNFIIGGSQYATVGTYGTAGSQSFDFFDVGEVFNCDDTYPNGTVVCPGDDDQMMKCTHEGCHAASVISYNPGLALGEDKHDDGIHYLALCGRVLVLTAEDIPLRALVVSDGRGGVRAQKNGEAAFSMGVAISKARQGDDKHWRVGVLLRPQFCILK